MKINPKYVLPFPKLLLKKPSDSFFIDIKALIGKQLYIL